MTVAILAAGWAVLSLVVAVLFGRAIRLADELEERDHARLLRATPHHCTRCGRTLP